MHYKAEGFLGRSNVTTTRQPRPTHFLQTEVYLYSTSLGQAPQSRYSLSAAQHLTRLRRPFDVQGRVRYVHLSRRCKKAEYVLTVPGCRILLTETLLLQTTNNTTISSDEQSLLALLPPPITDEGYSSIGLHDSLPPTLSSISIACASGPWGTVNFGEWSGWRHNATK